MRTETYQFTLSGVVMLCFAGSAFSAWHHDLTWTIAAQIFGYGFLFWDNLRMGRRKG